MWPVMKVGSKSCDLWTIRAVRSVFQNKLYQRASAGLAELGILNVWLMEDGTEAAQEQLHLRVHAATDRGRLLDVRYVLTAGREPITLRGQTNQNKGYGGLVLRTPHESRRTDTVITTDQGRAEGDSLRAPYGWADLSARMPGGDGVSGVTVIPARSHPDFPPGWMLRHYGVLNPAWPGTREFVMQPGVPLELSYRIYVHRGDLAEGAVAQVCDQWQQSR